MDRTTIRRSKEQDIKKYGLVKIEYYDNTLQLTMSCERFLLLQKYFNNPDNFKDALSPNNKNGEIEISLFMPTSEV